MNAWSRRRKRIIFLIFISILIVLVGIPLFFVFYRTPTCSDGVQNGDETGIDCGGGCQMLCPASSLPLILKGDPRILKVTDEAFEVVALVENPNATGEIYRAGYTFKLYDASSTLPIKTIDGEVYVPKGTTFAVFEGPFNIEGGGVPLRATLEWKEATLSWQKNTSSQPELTIKNLHISREDTNPRLDASIENASLGSVSNIYLVALISNESGSIFAASKTFIDNLPVGASAPIVFTWPKPFTDKVLDIDVLIRILPDRSLTR